jgi:Domain of unknown function (DUF4404)
MRRLLDELSGAIGRSKRAEDREALTRLHQEVEGRLQRAEKDEHSGFVEALEKAEIRFETDHPTLGQALRSAVEVLSAGGI